MNRYRYHLFGLRIESDVELPELITLPEVAGTETDLHISDCRGEVAIDGFVLDIAGVAKFVVSNGTFIAIYPEAGAGEREVRLFLLGSAIGLALLQRGVLPLHANAIELGGFAVAFMGPSGAGKSTLAAWFLDEGIRILADDICVIRQGNDDIPLAYPGLPRLRLWQDALLESGRSVSDYPLSFHSEGDERQKYDVRVSGDAIAKVELPLRALFVLDEGPEFMIEPLTGMAAVEAVSANTYRGTYIGEIGKPRTHLEACLSLVRGTSIYKLTRPFSRAHFDTHCRTILAFCEAQVQAGDRT